MRKGDWICTFTGVAFYPMDPEPEEVRLEDIAHALALLCRFGGHCREFYSVAEHSVRGIRALRSAGHGAILQRAFLLHDASEAYLVDVPRPIKQYLPGYSDIEDEIHRTILLRFPLNARGYKPTEKGWQVIKDMDNRMLATEKRDLMPNRTWNDEPVRGWAPLPDPLPEVIEPWTWRRAEREFLDEAHRLGIK